MKKKMQLSLFYGSWALLNQVANQNKPAKSWHTNCTIDKKRKQYIDCLSTQCFHLAVIEFYF